MLSMKASSIGRMWKHQALGKPAREKHRTQSQRSSWLIDWFHVMSCHVISFLFLDSEDYSSFVNKLVLFARDMLWKLQQFSCGHLTPGYNLELMKLLNVLCENHFALLQTVISQQRIGVKCRRQTVAWSKGSAATTRQKMKVKTS